MLGQLRKSIGMILLRLESTAELRDAKASALLFCPLGNYWMLISSKFVIKFFTKER